jgi:hypothetical protein
MKKLNFWKAEKAVVKDPTLNAKSVGLWLVTVVTTMLVTWLLAPAKKQEGCKETEVEPKDEPVEVEESSVEVSEDASKETSEKQQEACKDGEQKKE